MPVEFIEAWDAVDEPGGSPPAERLPRAGNLFAEDVVPKQEPSQPTPPTSITPSLIAPVSALPEAPEPPKARVSALPDATAEPAPEPDWAEPSPPSPIEGAAPSAAERARARFEAERGAAPSDVGLAQTEPFFGAKDIDPVALAELEALSPEIHLVSADLGDIFLVATHTGRDRYELTYREAATLRQLVDQFPGARVVELRPAPRHEAGEHAAQQGWDA